MMHTSGNMWTVRCKYVTKLMNPQDMGKKMQFLYGAQNEGSVCFEAEYRDLYDEVPAASWWGWNF
eukprot:12888623-Ditylum_brightwellii.AAC.1